VDDKTIKASQNAKESLKFFTRKYEKAFFQDMKDLNNEKPTILRATENINNMVRMIQILMKKGYAYKAKDGIYFSVNKFKGYGKLAGLKKVKRIKQRITSDEYDKENIQDFALWKFHTEKDGNNYWNTSLGKGRPGWHIECSVMSTKILGNTFDIHTGGNDLIFPHHTNEIAQSEAATGKPFVRYWIHSGFLTMKKGKMSKSLGNILTLNEVKKLGFKALDFRYLCLTTHYRKPLEFSKENLEAARNSYQRLKNIIAEIKNDNKTNKKYLELFKKSLENDINIPKGLQILWRLVRDEKAEGKINTIKEMDKVLSLDLLKKEKIPIPSEIKGLLKKRDIARKKKDWKLADDLRNKIKSLGYSLEDTSKGSKIKK
ncbi:MAG: cysteine--tRNA ligase, partial [Candidatus Nanoarchaeia archaeon]